VTNKIIVKEEATTPHQKWRRKNKIFTGKK